MTLDLEDVRSFIREHHVHFDVGARIEIVAGERARVGDELRLWAVHPKRTRALPGCERCRSLFEGLRRVALAITDGDLAALGSIQPFRPALYESRMMTDADEIALEVWSPEDAPGSRGMQSGWSRRIREGLRAIGVPER